MPTHNQWILADYRKGTFLSALSILLSWHTPISALARKQNLHNPKAHKSALSLAHQHSTHATVSQQRRKSWFFLENTIPDINLYCKTHGTLWTVIHFLTRSVILKSRGFNAILLIEKQLVTSVSIVDCWKCTWSTEAKSHHKVLGFQWDELPCIWFAEELP